MRKSKFKWILVGLMCMIMSTNVFADSFEMDGDFNDWDQVQAVDTSGISIFFNRVATTIDDNYLYIYAVEKSTNSWENYFSYANPIIVGENGNETPLVIVDEYKIYGNTHELSVKKQNGWEDIQDAIGKRTKKDTDDHTYEWEVKIPTKDFGKIKECKIKVDWCNYVTFTPSKSGQGENETKIEEETTQNETTVNKPTTSGIVIDGSYNDWKDYPHAFVTNWNMPDSQRNENNCRQLSIVHDDQYLYFHVKMIGGWWDPFNGNEYHITAGGKTITINLRTEYNQHLPGGYVHNGVNDLNVFYKNKTGYFEDEKYIKGAEAKLTVTPGHADEAEVKVPLSIFKDVYGIDTDDLKEITITNPNLFIDKVTSAGSSTGPIWGVLICMATVAAGLGIMKRKKFKYGVKEN